MTKKTKTEHFWRLAFVRGRCTRCARKDLCEFPAEEFGSSATSATCRHLFCVCSAKVMTVVIKFDVSVRFVFVLNLPPSPPDFRTRTYLVLITGILKCFIITEDVWHIQSDFFVVVEDFFFNLNAFNEYFLCMSFCLLKPNHVISSIFIVRGLKNSCFIAGKRVRDGFLCKIFV